MIEIPIPREIIKHAEELAARYKFKYLKFNNRAGVIYDNDWIAGVEYENKNVNFSEGDQVLYLFISIDDHMDKILTIIEEL